MTRTQGPVLLTGATGFVGMELLVRVLEQTDRDVVALVRAADDRAAQARVDEVLQTLLTEEQLPAAARRVRAIAADLETPGLGLSREARDELVGSIQAVVHCAASISFTLDLDAARRVNVDGTKAMLDLAVQARERGSLDRFVHVSTAYVAGDRNGRAGEGQGDVGQRFRNTYERTKLEAEQAVHESGLPAAILRPSVIVGDSVTGWTPAFNVIYWPLQAFARGLLPSFPGDPDALMDIVPVDAVADALLELLCPPARCGIFHVVAGDGAATNSTLSAMAADAFGAPAPRFVAPGEDPAAEARYGVLLPYFRVRCVFDGERGREELGVSPPPIEEYFPALMRYAREARWGRRPARRWEVAERELARVA